jgi:hypothetical protein
VIARHFSSSKQFTMPSPKPVNTNQTAYEPPTVISAAPTDDWLFAYFPKSNGEGTGCLWKRGAQIDSWVVNEWWTFPAQKAPVIAEWLGAPREVRISTILQQTFLINLSVDNRQFWSTGSSFPERLYPPDL